MSLRRVAAIALSAVLAASLLAGCGQKPAAPAQPQPGAAAQPQPQQPQQPQEAKKLKVGLVFDVGGRGDLSFNDSAYAGLERAQKEFGDKIEVKYLEPSAGGENREQLLRLLAEEKTDLIFGVGFLFTEHITKVAKEFPQVKFGLIDGFIDGLKDDSNVVSLLFKEHEGSFLVGAAAGLKTKTNKVGFVGGMKIPLIERFESGYIAGVKYVNPKAEVFSDYIGTTGDAFKDPVKGKELALAHYNKGSDVEYHASGASGIGVIEAAAAKQKLVIGVDSDQSLSAKEDQRPYILTSMLKRVDVAVYETIKSLVEGKWKGGYRVFGLADDGVGYAENQYNQQMLADIKPRLEDLKKRIVAGEIQVPVDLKELEAFLAKLPR
ncbi:BMP family lipoprotein [Caldinitratiruptor microaerophilus]|uniref:BMP family ABC transporter substrate-binding protein n=1 Tax=Caldinitratiruptor microaerophilus TaxID=671077 RepID=A0AA35CLV7_9FIRM|nr:BMP family ABC transporter substrate-binding protein [Caldinitratiruptor microaerophilus]BDG59711.1 BMP family ABC transporter substrate-binding protein [Caldinitratiruptor microaerophilus]